MSRLAPLRRRLALWLCPDLTPVLSTIADEFSDIPEWPGTVIPHWWHNTELRTFLTRSHRKIRMVDAHAEAVRRFGSLAPSQSDLHRYWQRLDVLRSLNSTPLEEPK